MGLTPEELADIVTGGLQKLNKGDVVQLAQTYQEYTVTKWLTKGKAKIISGGYGDRWTIFDTLPDDAAGHIQLWEPDSVNVQPLLKTAQIGWRFAQQQWAYEYHEMLMNKGAEQIADIIKVREAGADLRMMDALEAAAWGPAPALNDEVLPYGVRYWLTADGLAPSGHTLVANLNPSLAENAAWKNHYFTATAFTYEQFTEQVSDAKYTTGWKDPIGFSQEMIKSPVSQQLYGARYVHNQIKRLARAQNDSNGNDLDSKEGIALVSGSPLIPVRYLDTAGTAGVPLNLLYGIDHATFYPIILEGDNMRRTGPMRTSDKKDVYVVFKNLTYNYVCRDRRRNFVGTLPTAAAAA